MKDELFKSLDELQKLMKYYVTLYITWLLVFISIHLGKSNQSEFNFLNISINTRWSSFIFGVCFFIFILILYLRIYNLKLIVQKLNYHNAWDQKHISNIKSTNWLLSPLSESKIGPMLFFIVVLVGLIHLNFLTCAHFWFSGYSTTFRLIGWADLFFLAASLLIICFVAKTLCIMRGGPSLRRILITVFSINIVVTLSIFIYFFLFLGTPFCKPSQSEQDEITQKVSEFKYVFGDHYDGERKLWVWPTYWNELTFESKKKLMEFAGLLCKIKNRGPIYIEVKDYKTGKTIAIYSKNYGLTVY